MGTENAKAQTKDSESSKNNRKPDYFVHATIPTQNGSRIGSKLGVAFNHYKGGGLSVYMDGIPIAREGQVELVIYPIQS